MKWTAHTWGQFVMERAQSSNWNASLFSCSNLLQFKFWLTSQRDTVNRNKIFIIPLWQLKRGQWCEIHEYVKNYIIISQSMLFDSKSADQSKCPKNVQQLCGFGLHTNHRENMGMQRPSANMVKMESNCLFCSRNSVCTVLVTINLSIMRCLELILIRKCHFFPFRFSQTWICSTSMVNRLHGCSHYCIILM